MTPPGLKSNQWDNLSMWEQCLLIAYNQVRMVEEAKEFEILVKSRIGI